MTFRRFESAPRKVIETKINGRNTWRIDVEHEETCPVCGEPPPLDVERGLCRDCYRILEITRKTTAAA